MATSSDDEVVLAAVVDDDGNDLTEGALFMWGVSGEPITWAATTYQPIIAAARMANTGFGSLAGVQAVLDMVYPGYGYDAADVTIAHPPTAAFTAVDGAAVGVVQVDLTDDAELGLPNEQVTWDFGDGTAVTHGPWSQEHTYAEPGTYTIRVSEMVAGVLYSTTQDYTVEEPEVDPQDGGGDDVDCDYDPSQYTVDEVLAYCEANPDHVFAVVAAEEAGKNRVTLLDRL